MERRRSFALFVGNQTVLLLRSPPETDFDPQGQIWMAPLHLILFHEDQASLLSFPLLWGDLFPRYNNLTSNVAIPLKIRPFFPGFITPSQASILSFSSFKNISLLLKRIHSMIEIINFPRDSSLFLILTSRKINLLRVQKTDHKGGFLLDQTSAKMGRSS